MSSIKAINVEVVTSAVTGALAAVTVRTDNRDRIAWDLARGRNKWPQAQEAPSLWATHIAYTALRRAGEVSCSFEEFSEATVSAEPEVIDVDPTRTATAGA